MTTHVLFFYFTNTYRVHREMFQYSASGLVFKQLPWTQKMLMYDKNVCDSYISSFCRRPPYYPNCQMGLDAVCEQQKRRPACASVLSDQRLCYSHFSSSSKYM